MPPVSMEGEMAAGIARSAGPRSTAARKTASIPLAVVFIWLSYTEFRKPTLTLKVPGTGDTASQTSQPPPRALLH